MNNLTLPKDLQNIVNRYTHNLNFTECLEDVEDYNHNIYTHLCHYHDNYRVFSKQGWDYDYLNASYGGDNEEEDYARGWREYFASRNNEDSEEDTDDDDDY